MSQILEALVIATAAIGGSFLIASVLRRRLPFLWRRIVTEYPHDPRIEYPDGSDDPPCSTPHTGDGPPRRAFAYLADGSAPFLAVFAIPFFLVVAWAAVSHGAYGWVATARDWWTHRTDMEEVQMVAAVAMVVSLLITGVVILSFRLGLALHDGGLPSMIRRITMKRLVIALALLASAATAYNASDYYAAGHDYWRQRTEWRSENYYIGTFGCYICFHKVDFWQAKGVSPCGAKATCGNCGHTNTYRHDTLPPD